MATAGAQQKPAVSASSKGSHQQMNVGLKVEPQFCPVDVNDPFDTVEWEVRSAEIKDENGNWKGLKATQDHRGLKVTQDHPVRPGRQALKAKPGHKDLKGHRARRAPTPPRP